MAAAFSTTLDKNVRLDTGRKLEKLSKSRDGFFSNGHNTAFFMELGIEAELNERFTTLLIIGSKSSIQQRRRETGTGLREHDLAAIFSQNQLLLLLLLLKIESL